ncbi:hypothetical protein HPP92_015604, partial [Vanilla planifolia]
MVKTLLLTEGTQQLEEEWLTVGCYQVQGVHDMNTNLRELKSKPCRIRKYGSIRINGSKR